MNRVKRVALGLRAVAMVAVGALHFVDPQPFVRIVPSWFVGSGPNAEAYALWLVWISGVAEIAGGLGVLLPRTRRAAAWGLIALYVAVFPANLYMAIEQIQLDPEHPMPDWLFWVRLPFQLLFIAWAYWFTRPDPKHPE